MSVSLDTLIKTHREEQAVRAELCDLASGAAAVGGEDEFTAVERLHALRRGLASLDAMAEAGEVVRFFLSHVREQGGRLLLLRQWTQGLRVLLAEGVQLPERMVDPKATRPKIVPVDADDIFAVTAREKVVYSGPYPRDNFPRELARELGGDENRPVLIMPLPLRGRWSTFVYVDWIDFTAAERVAEATLLARFAVLRLYCAEMDVLPHGRRAREILARERQRQQERLKAGYEDLAPGDLPPEKVYELVGELTAMPQVAGHLLQMLDDPRTTAAQLEQEINKDLVLTAKILRIANSSFYESVSEARTIRDAIVRLGFKSVRNWILVNASQTAFPGVRSDPVLHRIWIRSIRSAYGAQRVADHVGFADREVVFVGGLVQNIGQLLLARALPGLYERLEEAAAARGVPQWRVEQERLGYDHGALGALLIEAWNLSGDIEHGVRYHHDLARDEDPRRLAPMIALGEELALLAETPGEDADMARREAWRRSEAAARLGVGEEDFLALAVAVAEAETEVCL